MRLVLSGVFCAGTLVGATAALAADPPHFFYVVKDGNDLWFLDEVAGAKAEADKLGAKFTSQNVELDANLAITGVDNAIAGGAAGIVIVVPEQQIGPAVLKKAKDAGIPMIAVDDGIVDDAGKRRRSSVSPRWRRASRSAMRSPTSTRNSAGRSPDRRLRS